jgi:predicted acylesterase/phospholipase RssA
MSKRILFVRSGGGLMGLDIHCGIWSALAERGIEPTDCHGTSAGAIGGHWGRTPLGTRHWGRSYR